MARKQKAPASSNLPAIAQPKGRDELTRQAMPRSGGRFGDGQIYQMFNRYSPEAFGLSMSAKQSTSSAHNLVFIRDPILYDLYDEMVDRDPIIAMGIRHIVAQVLALEVRFEPADESEKAIEIARAAEKDLKIDGSDSGWNALVETLVRGIVAHGLAVNEIVWKYDERERRMAASKYLWRHPGQFTFDSDGNLMLWHGFGKKETPKAADEFDVLPLKFAVARTPGMYGSPFGRSAIHELRWFWSFKRTMILAYLSAIDKYGTPLAEITVKGAQDDGLDDRMAAAKDILNNLTRDNGVVLPEGMELKWESRGASAGTLPHKDAIEFIDGNMLKVLLGSTLHVQEAQFGNRAMGETHERTGAQYGGSTVRHIESAINGTVVRPWMLMNFGGTDLAPVVRLDDDTETDVDQAVKVIETGRKMGLRQRASQAREWLGIEMAEDGEEAVEGAPDPDPIIDPDDLKFSQKKKNSITFADKRPSLKDAAKRIRRNEAIAARLKELAQPEIQKALDEVRLALSDWKPEHPLQPNMAGAVIPTVRLDADPIEKALLGLRALAARDTLALAQRSVSFEDEGGAESAGIYDDGIEWLRSEGFVKASETAQLSEAIRRIDPLYNSRIARNTIQNMARKISRDIAIEATVQIERHLVAAVERGTTIGEFLKQMDTLAAEQALPGATDAYLENVFRTETSSAYGNMTREASESKEVADFFWGYEIFNPDDDRSRESHAAINGLRVKKGSEAFNAMPTPPFSYQCRCTIIPLYSGDPGNSDFEEPSNALSLIQNIEGF
jgi:SPP1 gp7 family putative phage head morphogenesis protein